MRTVVWIVAANLLVAMIGVALAQSSAKAYRIGWLGDGSAPSSGDFQQGLHDLGYVEGRNFVIVPRYASGNVDRLSDLAAELVLAPVDVIVTSGEPAALAARRATKSIPIVVTETGADPVKVGLVTSLARPEANVTGLDTLSNDLGPKRLQVLKAEIAPKASRIAVFWNPTNPGNKGCVEEIQAGAKELGLQVLSLEVKDASALERAFANMASDPAEALAVCWDSVLLERAGAIAEFALKRRLPSVAPLREYAEAGLLMSIGVNLPAHKRRAAYYVDKILKGTKPANLPVERAAQFDTVLNLKTAKAIGFPFSPSLRFNADEVVQ